MEVHDRWGALAPFYAEMRQTFDIDLVIQLSIEPETKGNLIRALESYGFEPFTSWDDALYDWPHQSFLTLIEKKTSLKIDINLLNLEAINLDKYKMLGRDAIPRREKINYLGIKCWAQSKEDFIIAKLVYEGYQDYKDALSCWVRFENSLDVAYLLKKSEEYGVHMLFEALMEKKPVGEVFPD